MAMVLFQMLLHHPVADASEAAFELKVWCCDRSALSFNTLGDASCCDRSCDESTGTSDSDSIKLFPKTVSAAVAAH